MNLGKKRMESMEAETIYSIGVLGMLFLSHDPRILVNQYLQNQ